MDQSLSECQSSIKQLKEELHSLLQLPTTQSIIDKLPSDSPKTTNLCVEESPSLIQPSRSSIYQISNDLLEVERLFTQIQNSINSSTLQSVPLEESIILLQESLAELKSQLKYISEKTKVNRF